MCTSCVGGCRSVGVLRAIYSLRFGGRLNLRGVKFGSVIREGLILLFKYSCNFR